MLANDIPGKFPIPWANSATAPDIRPIPTLSQIGIQAGAASLTDGFVPVNFLPIGAGGTPMWGADLNGILQQLSQWARWQGAAGPVSYDAAFSSATNGYPKGTVLAAAGNTGYYWFNLADANTSNPDAGGANWQSFSPLAITTGDTKWRPTSETLPGWVKANATTIGSAASGANQLADSGAAPLYAWHWTNFNNAQCPVTGGRGVSAAADFAANKPIQVLDMRGTAAHGMDTMGGGATTRLSGVPVTSGAPTQAGSVLGENLHSLTGGETGPHTHTGTTDLAGAKSISMGVNPNRDTVSGVGTVMDRSAGTTQTADNHTHTFTTNSSGSGTAHNTVDLSMVGTWYLKL